MNKKIRSFFNLLNAIRIKPIALTLLILLCLISSCTVRKGIQSFLFGNALEHTLAGKPGKNLFNRNAVSITCGQAQSMVDLQSSAKPEMASMILLCALLPAFLLSSNHTIKDQRELPVPYATWQWSCLPLFLRNRLLLI